MRSLEIFGENFVNSNNTYTVSLGDALKTKVYDQKPATQWITTGSAEGTPETFLIEFKTATGTDATRIIDRLVLLNCNLAQFYAEYWNGAAWVTIAESVFNGGSPNANANVLIEIATPISTQKIRLTMSNTIGAVAEKKIGEIKACLFTLSVRHQVEINRKDWDDGNAYRLRGGGLVNFRTVSKFEAGVRILQLTLTNYEIVMPLVRERTRMTWVFYKDFRVADTYELAATSPLEERLDRKMYLYDLGFDVKEF